MSKNIVFMVNIRDVNQSNRTATYQLSIDSWKSYCDQHGFEFFILTERIQSENIMNANWHKLYVFELLKNYNIDYDKILVVDADTIIHPNAPSIFDECGNGLGVVHNSGSYDWVLRSIEVYSKLLFDNYKFPFWEYFNSGVMVINKTHEPLYARILEFYGENITDILNIQNKYHVGTDQPILNFFTQRDNIKLEMLPYKWNMQDMCRREILDLEMTFVEYGWLYHFNAIPVNYKLDNSGMTSSQQWMTYTYNKLYSK